LQKSRLNAHPNLKMGMGNGESFDRLRNRGMGNGGKDFHPFVVRQPRMVSSLKIRQRAFMQFAQRSGVGVGRKFSSLCCAYSIWEAVLQRQRLLYP
jgi:hypothetical protein